MIGCSKQCKCGLKQCDNFVIAAVGNNHNARITSDLKMNIMWRINYSADSNWICFESVFDGKSTKLQMKLHIDQSSIES